MEQRRVGIRGGGAPWPSPLPGRPPCLHISSGTSRTEEVASEGCVLPSGSGWQRWGLLLGGLGGQEPTGPGPASRRSKRQSLNTPQQMSDVNLVLK